MSDENAKTPPDKRPPGEPKQSGRVAYDSKGNPVWEWETSTGVYDRNVSTQRLKKLEAKLSLEETQPVFKPKDLSLQEPERLPGGGMNPYDTGGRSSGNAPAAHPALSHKQVASRAVVSNSLASKYASAARKNAPAKPQGFWQKLKTRFGGDK
ncbi:MAG: hypothetical protein AB7T07_11495 [Steroidobacteraceae bacterium]